MTLFLNLRARPTGGEIADAVAVHQINVDPATFDVTEPSSAPIDIATAVLGKNVLLAMHGFNVNQTHGYQSLSNWSSHLQLDDTWLFIGIVWPGDSSWLGPLCYPGEGKHAMACGNLLASFLSKNFAGAHSVSLVSHSLGARFLLQTVTALQTLTPQITVRQVAIMAGAINYDSLTAEYAVAASSVEKIALLASAKDEVLTAAFPLGNIFEGIIDAGHPWFTSALGHKGPKTYLTGKNIGAFQLPSGWNFNHGSYLQLAPPLNPLLALPLDVVPEGSPPPAPQCDPPEWRSSWSASFVSSRFR